MTAAVPAHLPPVRREAPALPTKPAYLLGYTWASKTAFCESPGSGARALHVTPFLQPLFDHVGLHRRRLAGVDVVVIGDGCRQQPPYL